MGAQNLTRTSFVGPVFRDLARVVLARSTANSSLAGYGAFVDRTAISGTDSQYRPDISTGLIDLAAGDGLELFFFGEGADNTTAGYRITALIPMIGSDGTVAGYLQTGRARGILTFSTATAGATLASRVSDLQSGDRIADTITNTYTGAAGVTLWSPAAVEANTAGFIRLTGEQVQYYSVAVDVSAGGSPATSVTVLARRVQGLAQRGLV